MDRSQMSAEEFAYRARSEEEQRRLEIARAADKRAREEREKQRLTAEEERKEAARQAAEASLKEELRVDFFAGSPSATEADFEALYPRLREDRLILESRRDRVAEEALALASSNRELNSFF